MEFRKRLLQTLRAFQPVLKEPGVMIAGSEVPNLLEPDAASTLVVSQDVDIAIPVSRVDAIKVHLRSVKGFSPFKNEPTIWLPKDPYCIEVNFLGMDERGETYIHEDNELPLLVFSQLSLLHPGKTVSVEGLTIPLPRPAGLILEKLITDRSGEKGDRDILVALALLLISGEDDIRELEDEYLRLPQDQRYTVRSGLTVMSLMGPKENMPDPTAQRARAADILKRLESREQKT